MVHARVNSTALSRVPWPNSCPLAGFFARVLAPHNQLQPEGVEIHPSFEIKKPVPAVDGAALVKHGCIIVKRAMNLLFPGIRFKAGQLAEWVTRRPVRLPR
jgi:hypothetical protein